MREGEGERKTETKLFSWKNSRVWQPLQNIELLGFWHFITILQTLRNATTSATTSISTISHKLLEMRKFCTYSKRPDETTQRIRTWKFDEEKTDTWPASCGPFLSSAPTLWQSITFFPFLCVYYCMAVMQIWPEYLSTHNQSTRLHILLFRRIYVLQICGATSWYCHCALP